MLQNHSRCRDGRGCGQHPLHADGAGAGGPSEEGSIIDSEEEDRRFFADFEDQSVFDWEALSVRSAYEEEAEAVWSPDSLEGGRAAGFTSRTEAWVASAGNLRHGQDPRSSLDEGHRAGQGHEMERKREEGLRGLADEMRRRDAEEGWPLQEQLAALQDEDRKDILRIMHEGPGRFKPIERKTTRKTKGSTAMTRNPTMTRKTNSRQTPATVTR